MCGIADEEHAAVPVVVEAKRICRIDAPPLQLPWLFVADIPEDSADAAADVLEMVSGALRLAFNTYRPVALLIGQRVLGAKDFRKLAEGAPQ